MRPMWEEQGWDEEPEEEEQIQSMSCLREETKDDGGMRTLEQEVSAEEAAKMNYKGRWLKVEAEVDTGACIPMMPKGIAKHLPIRESEGSKRGQVFLSANGSPIPNLGCFKPEVVVESGKAATMTFQAAKVRKLLFAVSACKFVQSFF